VRRAAALVPADSTTGSGSHPDGLAAGSRSGVCGREGRLRVGGRGAASGAGALIELCIIDHGAILEDVLDREALPDQLVRDQR
jgi:hypothetical protein